MSAAVIASVLGAGAVGALVRYLVSRAFASARFPWAVLTVNVIGSGLGGAVLALAERAELSTDVRLIVLTGLCGGLTTFSTFAVDSVELILDGRFRAVVLSVAANLVLGVGSASATYLLLR